MRFIYILVCPRALSLGLHFLPYNYTAPVSHVIAEHDVEHHLYADDTHLGMCEYLAHKANLLGMKIA